MSLSKEEFFQQIDCLIRSEGFAFICVGADDDAPPYAYTVGLTESCACPELLIFGVGERIANAVFHAVVSRLKTGTRFSDGTLLVDVLNLPCAIKAVSDEAARPFALNVFSRYMSTPHKPVFQQVVYPDRGGVFPWEPGYEEGMRVTQTELWTSKN